MNNCPPNFFLLHVSSTESREIHSFLMNPETGELNLNELIAVPGSGAPTRGNIPLIWGRDGKVLYAHVRTEPYPISAFLLDSDSRKLQLLETISMSAPMAYLSTSLDGRFMLGASYDDALITVNSIQSNGSLVNLDKQIISTPPKAHCIISAPFGRFVYATSVDGDAILVYSFDEQLGRLVELEQLRTAAKVGSGPRHLVFHPLLDYLYCINEHDGSLTVYSVDQNSGGLRQLQSISLVPHDFKGNALASDIHITPNGMYIYASVRKTNSINAFHINAVTGMLSNIGVYEVEANPRGFAIDPSGSFLVCAGQESNHIAVYKIQSNSGHITLLARYPVGKRPSWIEIVSMPNLKEN